MSVVKTFRKADDIDELFGEQPRDSTPNKRLGMQKNFSLASLVSNTKNTEATSELYH